MPLSAALLRCYVMLLAFIITDFHAATFIIAAERFAMRAARRYAIIFRLSIIDICYCCY